MRFYLLSVHYRSPLDFDDEKLAVAGKGLERLRNAYTALESGLRMTAPDADAAARETLLAEVTQAETAFQEAMDDDFNTALALASLFDLAKAVNTYLKQSKLDGEALAAAKAAFDRLLAVIGIDFAPKEEADGEVIALMVQVLLTLRQNARSAKDFAVADFLRDACKAEGLVIEDTPQGMSWKWAGEAPESADSVMQAIIAVRKAARAEKNYALADAIRDGLGQAGLILEDTPQGTSWKKA